MHCAYQMLERVIKISAISVHLKLTSSSDRSLMAAFDIGTLDIGTQLEVIGAATRPFQLATRRLKQSRMGDVSVSKML
jgi:hypothetical protein